jgi:uncharacterized damage-inducible protein DinB
MKNVVFRHSLMQVLSHVISTIDIWLKLWEQAVPSFGGRIKWRKKSFADYHNNM